jgi:hypothetical protein
MYYPILLSKAGELTALSHLSNAVKQNVSPVIEILPNTLERVELHLTSNWLFEGNQILLDFSLFDPFDRTAVRAFFTRLIGQGINAIPVIQQNSDARYLALVQQLVANLGCKVCIRASNSSGGFVNYNNTVQTLVGQVGVTRANTILLLDLGYVQQNNYNILASLAVNIIQSVPQIAQWSDIVIASSSFPENLSALVPPGRLFRLQRYEWDIWLALQSVAVIAGFVSYGDFGTKYPFYSEANFQGSCSIKYTVEREFVIYRGEISGNHAQGNGQYIIFANRLIHTPDYSGNTFSWGDDQIDFYAHQVLTDPKRKTGNAKSWVEMSQNHHVTLIVDIL